MIVDRISGIVLKNDLARSLDKAGEREFIVGAVVFSRGPCPAWVTPLFQMPEQLWLRG